jgi:hypothetical protein
MSATIRHSSLPKLAQCAKYESNPVAGPAAERGTRLDAAFRAFLMGEPVPVELSTEEQENVMWAVDTVRDLADGGEIEADEVNLKVNTPGLSHVGTEDARCENEAMSFDLKTGQIRSYYEQMAAYALGNMDRSFNETWTCCLLFCDQREFTRIEFSYATAKAVVDGVLAAVNDPNAVATPCQYCSWCVKGDTCPARTGPIIETLAVVESQPTGVSLEALKAGLLADPERLGAFLTTNAIFEDFVDDLKIKAKALMLHAHTVVPGWKLQTEAGREHFDRLAIVSAAVTGKSGLDDLVANCGGKMTGTKFREWCAKMGVPVQEKQAIVGKDIVKLVADKKKARKAK